MTLAEATLALMPMHLQVDAAGQILSAGPTLRRLVGDAATFEEAFEVVGQTPTGPLLRLAHAERVFLRTRTQPAQILRGRAVALPDGGLVLNLGLGIGLVEAIRGFGLTDRDFAPADLAMEFLFLHEANSAMTQELSRANRRLEDARSRAEAEAFTDPLTGLYNRRGLHLSFEALRQGTLHADPQHFALLVMDLDHFKTLNDSQGHAAGDAMLRHVADGLRAITRGIDTLSRIGGDEFVLLLPGLCDPAVLEAMGRRIIAQVERPVEIGGEMCRVSASLGAAISSRCRRIDWDCMAAEADGALYAAKHAGRGCIRIAAADEAEGS
ncbi:GGDEF domain-containing protein [Paracoccus chinensis]|uniref:Diguanylate cyclase (GGDEF) domain-containing protein n=1 Tax=Paracoccus chinensis TaxID=525640 RepID=A0A1G9EM44_9RHOB|nr:GGDEF domain-containing protein [Paracoccus chinensis]SDK77220.1 diguanylate cyclase (GGDEF) domain-containing protein [Paracoccus chinensis]